MKDTPSWRNKLFGFGYVFLAFMIIGAALPGSPDDGGPTGDAGIADAQTTTVVTHEKTEAQSTTVATDGGTTTVPVTTTKVTPTPTATPKPTPKPTPKSTVTYQVRVIYDGSYSGAMGTAGETHSYDGSGTQTFDIGGSDVHIISANAQKQDDSSKELKIQILKNGKVVKESSTTAAYGVAQTSASFYGW